MRKLGSTISNDKNIWVGLGLGAAAALILTFLLSIALTSFIQKGTLEESASAGIFCVRAISTLVGILIGAWISSKKTLPVIGGISLTYLLLLIGMGIVLFDGSFQNLWTGLLSVLTGAAVACIILLKPQKKRKIRPRYTK